MANGNRRSISISSLALVCALCIGCDASDINEASHRRDPFSTGGAASVESSPSKLSELRLEIGRLDAARLAAQGRNQDGAAQEIAKKIAELSARLGPLEEQVRREEQAEARHRAEAENATLERTFDERAKGLKRKCDAVREKKINDLTVGDYETARECGISLRLP